MTTQQKGQAAGLFGAVALFSALFSWLFIAGRFADPYVYVQVALGVIGLGIWIATNRGTMGEKVLGRGTFYGAISAVSALVLVAALVGVNYIAVKKPKTWDLTRDQVFTLSDQTVGVLKGLKDEVRVQAYYAGSEPEYSELDQRLKQYKSFTDKLVVEFIDPYKHPTQAKEANIAQGGPRIIVKAGSKESRAKELGEDALTNAIIDVTRGGSKKVYFTKGHGEHPVADATERGMKLFFNALKSEGYQPEEIVLAEHKEMPADAMALVIAGPTGSLQPGEAKLVQTWVETKNGKLIAMIDPAVTSGLEAALAAWGLTLDKDQVIDAQSQDPEIALAVEYADHPIATPRAGAAAQMTVFPVARSITKAGNVPAGWTVTELAKTGARSWGETSPIGADGRVEFNAGQDVKGPVTLAAAATKGSGENEARVVLIGNSGFASNGYYQFAGNRDFALNSVSWAGREEQRIAIRPKQRQSNHLFLSADQKHTMTLFAFDLLPFSLLFAGLLVWQTRKSR